MTTACDVWLSADFLSAAGCEVTVRPDGRVTASVGGVTHLLGVCGHDPQDCPPLTTARHERMEAAA